MFKELSRWQKGLLIFLYVLLVLMVIFSFNARKNIGQEGFEHCIQKKCETNGEAFCSKGREIRNCCLGAGGKISSNGCSFNS